MLRRYPAVALLFALIALSPLSGTALRAQSLASPGAGTWWRDATAPVSWTSPHGLEVQANLERHIAWQRASSGVEWADLELTVNGGPLMVHAVLVRFDPNAFRADLVRMVDASGVRGSWTVDSAAADARIALNAGQFTETGPWGWIVSNGREASAPGRGPLATGIAFDLSGDLHWLDPAALARARQSNQQFVTGFQSYPRLLAAGVISGAIRTGAGVDSKHRDARLALGQRLDGLVVIALTRFGVRESVVSRIPIGLTLRETAALMGALGCRDAVMLDGGLSAQLLVRTEAPDSALVWRGARRVPVALVFRKR